MEKLEKNIGLRSAVTIVIGSIIGSNIFMKPATMAAQLGSPVLLVVVWIVAGVISLFGAMAFAELGTMFPETGGQYIYIRKIYGEFIAYLYGWATVAVINTAAVAGIGFVCAEYLAYLFHVPRFDVATEHAVKWHIPFLADIFPLENFGVKTIAILIITGLGAINYISVRFGDAIQFVATLVKTLAILFLVGGLLFTGHGSLVNLIQNRSDFHLTGWPLFGAFMAATTGAFASYDGWSNVNMMAGEIKDPKRNLTRSLVFGLISCTVIYVLINLAFIYVLSMDGMAASSLVASDAAQKVFGLAGGALIAGLIVITAFGATHVNLYTCARIVFAMAQDKAFFASAGRVHRRFHTPGNAIVFMTVISDLFVLSGSFDFLTDMFIFMAWVFYLLAVLGVFFLRKRMPDHPRPYRVQGYPWVPWIFILFTLFYIGSTLYTDIANFNSGKSPIINSVFGVLLTLMGIPFYWYFNRQTRKNEQV